MEYLYKDLFQQLIIHNRRGGHKTYTTSAFTNSTMAADKAKYKFLNEDKVEKYVDECTVNVVIKYGQEDWRNIGDYISYDKDFSRRRYKYSTVIFVDTNKRISYDSPSFLTKLPVRIFFLEYIFPNKR
jgi:hypothetical protein